MPIPTKYLLPQNFPTFFLLSPNNGVQINTDWEQKENNFKKEKS